MKKISAAGVLLFLCFSAAFGQMERTVYQSFEIDSCQTVNLDVVGDFEMRKWAGNSILTETNIQIWKATPKILDFFIGEGRYEFASDRSPLAFKLFSKNKERKPIKTKEGECVEIIKVIIFVPDTFEWSPEDKNNLKLKEKPKEEVKDGTENNR